MTKWRGVALGLSALVLVLCLTFDLDWLRGALERYAAERAQREVHIGHLTLERLWPPTIVVDDLDVANAPWATEQPMAKIGRLEFKLSLAQLLRGRLVLPWVRLYEADVLLERDAGKRRNWVLSDPSGTEPGRMSIGSVSLDQARVRFIDHGVPFEIDVHATPLEAPEGGLTTQVRFEGRYHDASFAGDAQVGEVLSLRDVSTPFALRGRLEAGSTKLEVDGTLADVATLGAIDVRLRISGQTLANLYPFLLLPLPASPPYALAGHLVLKDGHYTLQELEGSIGQTDISGEASYLEARSPRPLLTAQLRSRLLNLSDLGPLVGVTTKASGAVAPPTQAQTRTREAARSKQRQRAGGKVLPNGAVTDDRLIPGGRFEGGRLQAIDADVTLDAAKLKGPAALALESLQATFRLRDAVLHLQPLLIGWAGGRISGDVTLDARQPTLLSSIEADARQVRIDRLFENVRSVSKGAGVIGARLRLKGAGNSIADAAAASDGQLGLVVSPGRVSNLVDATASLNGGKMIGLLLGGDKEIALRCGAVDFDISKGIGRSTLFVIDTEETRIDGDGRIDFRDERLDLTIEPKPKHAGILSLRTPVKIEGTFRNPDVRLEKAPLLLRAAGVLALAAVSPLAALLPLIETGPGSDSNCTQVLQDER